MTSYIHNVLVAVDQLLNALFNGHCDESISSHAYRLHRDGKPWGWLMPIINALFFWQREHCRRAYESERARMQMPPEYRSVN